MKSRIKSINPSNLIRCTYGFFLGLIIMFVVVRVFLVNSFDFDNMQRGIHYLISGINPWAEETKLAHFYNPPFSVLFLWPMLFTSAKFYIVIGGALLFGFIFYQRAWVALSWFATNTFLWIVAAGGIDMFVIGSGLLLLLSSDNNKNKWLKLILRVSAYGLLMVKPQGGLFIVFLYILLRRDWNGLFISVLLYGLPFLSLYPDWIKAVLSNPHLAQTVASHTIAAKFGFATGILIAFLLLVFHRWRYWQLGGVLAASLMPYGMPGLPIFLILTAVKPLRAIPAIIIYSALLASMTWINLPPGLDNSDYGSLLMAIYHISMLGLAIILAILSEPSSTDDFIFMPESIRIKVIGFLHPKNSQKA